MLFILCHVDCVHDIHSKYIQNNDYQFNVNEGKVYLYSLISREWLQRVPFKYSALIFVMYQIKKIRYTIGDRTVAQGDTGTVLGVYSSIHSGKSPGAVPW